VSAFYAAQQDGSGFRGSISEVEEGQPTVGERQEEATPEAGEREAPTTKPRVTHSPAPVIGKFRWEHEANL